MARAMGMKGAHEPMDFITALVRLQEDCGVAGLRVFDYEVTPAEFETGAIMPHAQGFK